MAKNDIISTTDAAKILDLTRQTVSRLAKDGKLKAQKLGREWMIDRGSVLDYLERNRDKSKFDPTR